MNTISIITVQLSVPLGKSIHRCKEGSIVHNHKVINHSITRPSRLSIWVILDMRRFVSGIKETHGDRNRLTHILRYYLSKKISYNCYSKIVGTYRTVLITKQICRCTLQNKYGEWSKIGTLRNEES